MNNFYTFFPQLVSAITSYVKGKLGQAFVESPQITLQKL
jgi:hypothetical protein